MRFQIFLLVVVTHFCTMEIDEFFFYPTEFNHEMSKLHRFAIMENAQLELATLLTVI